MKKIIAIILLVIMVVLCAGCATEVSREAIDVRYTEAYDRVETSYQHKFDILSGGFVLVPVVKTVHHEAKWEIRYRITYDNGGRSTEWCECSEREYNRVKRDLFAGGE